MSDLVALRESVTVLGRRDVDVVLTKTRRGRQSGEPYERMDIRCFVNCGHLDGSSWARWVRRIEVGL